MEFYNNNIVFIVVSVIGAAISLIYSLIKIIRELKESRKFDNEQLLLEAGKNIELLKNKLESKISNVENRVTNLEESVEKEFSHIKEIHSNEIKNLGEKIEQLREELRENHAKLFELLSKIIDNK